MVEPLVTRAWKVGRVATTGIAIVLVFFGMLLALWGISLVAEGSAVAGFIIGILGCTLTFTGGALAGLPWFSPPAKKREAGPTQP